MRRSDARRTAVGARIMSTFQGAVGMQHYCPCVTHRVGIGLVENSHVVASGQETIHKIPVETRLHPQIGMG